jgi:hypothetical protein
MPILNHMHRIGMGFNNAKYVIIIVSVILVAVPEYLMAQAHVSIKLLNQSDLSIEWMKKYLNLTDKQVHAVWKLNVRYAPRFDSIRQSGDDRFVKFERTYRVTMQRDNELKYILSEEQFVLYQRKKKHMYPGHAHSSDTLFSNNRHH